MRIAPDFDVRSPLEYPIRIAGEASLMKAFDAGRAAMRIGSPLATGPKRCQWGGVRARLTLALVQAWRRGWGYQARLVVRCRMGRP